MDDRINALMYTIYANIYYSGEIEVDLNSTLTETVQLTLRESSLCVLIYKIATDECFEYYLY